LELFLENMISKRNKPESQLNYLSDLRVECRQGHIDSDNKSNPCERKNSSKHESQAKGHLPRRQSESIVTLKEKESNVSVARNGILRKIGITMKMERNARERSSLFPDELQKAFASSGANIW
jgi:hypothetical protein